MVPELFRSEAMSARLDIAERQLQVLRDMNLAELAGAGDLAIQAEGTPYQLMTDAFKATLGTIVHVPEAVYNFVLETGEDVKYALERLGEVYEDY